MLEYTIRTFVLVWILGFIFTLDTDIICKRFYVKTAPWIQRILFIRYKERINLVGLVWQITLYVSTIVLTSAYKLNLITTIKSYKFCFKLMVTLLILWVVIGIIIELIMYYKNKKTRY